NPVGDPSLHSFGEYCYQVPSTLAGGYYKITGSEVSPHSAYPVAPMYFRIDTSVPAAPAAFNMSGPSKTGNPAGNYTKFKNPGFSGTYDLNNYNVVADGRPSLTMFNTQNGALEGGAGLNSDGSWFTSASNLADGIYSFVTRVTNEVGTQSSDSPAYSF